MGPPWPLNRFSSDSQGVRSAPEKGVQAVGGEMRQSL